MRRIYLSQTGLTNLKTTVSETNCLLDNLVWINHLMSYSEDVFMSSNKPALIESYSFAQFKPKHMQLLNKVAVVLGYRNFKELEAVTSQEHDRAEFIEVQSCPGLAEELAEIWTRELSTIHPLAAKTEFTNHTFSFFAKLAVDAWLLNADCRPDREREKVMISFSELRIARANGHWKIQTADDPLTLCIAEPTVSGSLLPYFALYTSEHDTEFLTEAGAFPEKDTFPVHDSWLRNTPIRLALWADHQVTCLGSISSFAPGPINEAPNEFPAYFGELGPSRLLAFLVAYDGDCGNIEVNREWYTKPMNTKERQTWLAENIGATF